MKNNKGQVLILFVFFLPIVVFLIIMVINYGLLSNQKLELENNIKSTIEYGLKLKIADNMIPNIEIKSKLEQLLEKNITYDTLEIIVNDTNITINITYKYDNFMKIFNQNINLSYYGSLTNGQIKIERR